MRAWTYTELMIQSGATAPHCVTVAENQFIPGRVASVQSRLRTVRHARVDWLPTCTLGTGSILEVGIQGVEVYRSPLLPFLAFGTTPADFIH